MWVYILFSLIVDLISVYYHKIHIEQIFKPCTLLLIYFDFQKDTDRYVKNGSHTMTMQRKFKQYLFFSLLGDVFMTYKDRNLVYFQLGILFFAAAHIHNLVLNLHVLGLSFIKDIKNLFLLGILGILNIWIYEFMIKDVPEEIKTYIVLYSGILQMASYMNMCRRNYSYYSTVNAILGSVLFLVSDFMIGLEEFKKMDSRWLQVAVHLTYFVAQYMLSTSIKQALHHDLLLKMKYMHYMKKQQLEQLGQKQSEKQKKKKKK